MTLADTFASVVEDAMTLDPDTVRATILETHDRLPGGGGYSETGVRAPRVEICHDPTCPQDDGWEHSHPVPDDPTGNAAMRPSRSDADLRALDQAVQTFVDNVGELVTRSASRGVPQTWEEAVNDAQLLDRDDAISVLERVWGHRDVNRWVTKAGDAVHDLALITGRHVTRQPNDHERTWTSDLADEQCCRVCLQLKLRVPVKARRLCAGCWQLSQDSREHTDDGEAIDPPPELIEEFRRIGNPHGPAWKKARSDWLHALERRRSRHCA